MSKKYIVRCVEKVVSEYIVEANSEEEAVLQRECGNYQSHEYVDMLDLESSEAEEIKD